MLLDIGGKRTHFTKSNSGVEGSGFAAQMKGKYIERIKS